MKLNSRTQSAQNPHNNSPVVLVHGLFGSLDNLGILARDLVNDYDILQVDMRNHGLSPRSPEMTYAAMAQDLIDTLDDRQIEKATFIGHSMGGKAVMALTALAPERIAGLVAIDIAPVDYHVRRHDEIFNAINAVTDAGAASRCYGINIRTSWAGKRFLPGLIRPCSSREATRRTSPMSIAIPCSPSSHRRERTSSPAPATGCMRRNRKPSCAPFVAI